MGKTKSVISKQISNSSQVCCLHFILWVKQWGTLTPLAINGSQSRKISEFKSVECTHDVKCQK